MILVNCTEIIFKLILVCVYDQSDNAYHENETKTCFDWNWGVALKGPSTWIQGILNDTGHVFLQ